MGGFVTTLPVGLDDYVECHNVYRFSCLLFSSMLPAYWRIELSLELSRLFTSSLNYLHNLGPPNLFTIRYFFLNRFKFFRRLSVCHYRSEFYFFNS